jgi:hypothetical protein
VQARESASPDPLHGPQLRRSGLRCRRERSGCPPQYPGSRQRRRVVCDQAVDAESKQRTRACRLVHRPGHDDVRYVEQCSDGLSIGKALVDRNTFECLIGETAKRQTQLWRAADGVHAAHGGALEGLEQPPPARADGEPSLGQVRLELTEDEVGQSLPRAFEIEHELGLRGRGREQLSQTQLGAPRRLEPPPIPENRDRPSGLQVPDLEPAAVKPDVSFYKGRLEALCGVEVGEAVPGAVCDEERAQPVGAEARQGWPVHRRRV